MSGDLQTPWRGPILAATDLSPAADAAVLQGAELAASAGVPFIVCHVLPEAFRVRVLFPQDAGIDRDTQDALEQRAREAVLQRALTVSGRAEADVTVEIASGSAHAGILEIADRVGAGLIVVGPGATAHRVARSALTPVLVARPSPTGGAVLGATDFSDPSLPAVRMAAAEAARRGARLRLLHCLDVDERAYLTSAGLHGGITVAPVPHAVLHELQVSARERLHDAMTAADAPGEAVVMLTSPAFGIVEAATAVATTLVVVGTRGRTGLARLALGSVAEAIIDRAPCSVLVVRLDAR